MAKIWHKVMGKSGFAIYRASASRTYVSYNPANGSFSSKMLMGNVPVEVLAKAPKSIKVKGEAWGVKVVRSYLEGERPVTHTIAFKGECAHKSNTWEGPKDNMQLVERQVPVNPDVVSFDTYSISDSGREQTNERIEYIRANIAKRDAGKLGEYEMSYRCLEVQIVELR